MRTWKPFNLSENYEEGHPVPDWIPSDFIELAGREIIVNPVDNKRYLGKFVYNRNPAPNSKHPLYKLRTEPNGKEANGTRIIAVPGPFDPNKQAPVMGVDVTQHRRNIFQPAERPAPPPLATQAVPQLTLNSSSSVRMRPMDVAEILFGNENGPSLGSSGRRDAHQAGEAAQREVDQEREATYRKREDNYQAREAAYKHRESVYLQVGQYAATGSVPEMKEEVDQDGVRHIGRNMSGFVITGGNFSTIGGNVYSGGYQHASTSSRRGETARLKTRHAAQQQGQASRRAGQSAATNSVPEIKVESNENGNIHIGRDMDDVL